MPVEIKPERSLSREGETSLGLPSFTRAAESVAK